MKCFFFYKNFLLELALAVAISALFTLFALSFEIWLLVSLFLLLIWHHLNEGKLLKMIDPEIDNEQGKKSVWEHISQTVAYYNKKSRREKFKTLRTLSKLNRNVQYYSDAIIICDSQGDISWCNNASQEMFDFYWHKKAQKNIFNIIFYDEFKNYFQKNKKNRPLVLLTNNEHYIEININEYDQQALVISARDITQFVQVLHSRQIFLSNLNHELRTPLTVLQGYLEMLAEQPDKDLFIHKAIEEMQAQSDRMTKLLTELSLLAKIETSSNEEHYPINLSEMVLAQHKNIAFLNKYHHQISFDIEPNIYVKGDEAQLQSIITNLINNAIRHSGEYCDIHVSLVPSKKGVRFCVSDNGIGIEAKHLPHLTERFYRVDESRSNKTGGTGLGLAIVKHALLQHHSHLEIRSELNKGSTFSFEMKQVEQQ